MKKLNKVMISILAVVTCLTIMPTKVKAAGLTLEQLQQKFPNKSYWNHVVKEGHGFSNYQDKADCNNPDGYTWSPCDSHSENVKVGGYSCNSFLSAMQCAGFVRKLSYDVYGSNCKLWPQTNIKSIKPGDVIHYTGGNTDPTYGHWVMVTGVNGNAISVGEAGAGGLCEIRWDRVLYINQMSIKAIYSAPYELGRTDVSKINFEKIEFDVEDTNMFVKVKASANQNGIYSSIGIALMDNDGHLISKKVEPFVKVGNSLNFWYDVKEELNVVLQKGTTYKYQLYTVFNEVEYSSEVMSFTTTGKLDLNGWKKIDNQWFYYIDSVAQTGWIKDNNLWYFMDESGVMQKGWIKDNGMWYYLNSCMLTGWQYIDNKWYFLDTQMKTGWQYINNKWYYLNTHMLTGWQYINDKWYYLDENGVMLTGIQYIDDILYRFDESGAWIK